METLYQVILQIGLLLFTQTKTPTTGGLESFFEKETFLGIKVDPNVILAISVSWNLKTCIFIHLKAVSIEKEFFGFKAKGAVLMWAIFAIIRRAASIIAFFTPSLGLFSLLHHWQAENTPFKVRLDQARDLKNNSALESIKINLYNMTKEVPWSSLDRWNYEDPAHPTPPPYTIYTGLSLQTIFLSFFGLSLLQVIAFFIVKVKTSDSFAAKEDYFLKFTHLLQVINLPFPFQDWDVGHYDSVQMVRGRYRKTEAEMMASFGVNFVFTLIFMVPLSYTGIVLLCFNAMDF